MASWVAEMQRPAGSMESMSRRRFPTSYAGNGRDDGITRPYTAGANKHLYEYVAP